MAFRPIHDRVLVRPIPMSEKTAADILAPDIADRQAQEGRIVATGDGCRDDDGMTQPLDVRKGDRILFSEGAGTQIKIAGEALIVLKEGDVLGTLG